MDIHVLMVEDDQRTRMALTAMLEKAGYCVTPAADGETALQMLAQHSFDVIITDIRMNDIDGIEVLNAARNESPAPAVILLTGYGSLETAIAAIRAGAYDYLLKPCSPAALLKCVDRALQRRNAEQRQVNALQTIAQIVAQFNEEEVFIKQLDQERTIDPLPPESEQPDRYTYVGALCIDRLRHTVSFDKELLHVTPTEYALLECLMDAGQRVVTYREIVRHTHGHDVDEEEAQTLLKSHVRNLRRKIPARYLVNVRGAGYILVNPDDTE